MRTSLALAFLKNGTRAFVGCRLSTIPGIGTVHLSGRAMHRYFWEAVSSGAPPAKALYSAKVRYAKGIPHRAGDKPGAHYPHKS